MYWTAKGKVCVSGTQVSNPAKPQDANKPHNFEVGLISRIVVTDDKFIPDSRFDRTDTKYDAGIICSI